jgi:hypothetical protein
MLLVDQTLAPSQAPNRLTCREHRMTTPEPTFDMSPSPGRPADWYPLRFEPGPAEPEICRSIAIERLNRATGWKLNRKQWEKQHTFTLKWVDEKKNSKAVSTRFTAIVEAMRNNRTWPENLPPVTPCWFESSVSLAMTFHAPGNQPVPPSLVMTLPPTLGDAFPLSPSIDREGVAFSSVTGMLLATIVRLHKSMVEQSARMMSPNDQVWLPQLFAFLNACVSVVDATLYQIYYKAQYDGAPWSWKFDPAKLGSPVSRRMMDKIQWVHAITGQHLPTVAEELDALGKLKHVRNHLNHFDPPVFAYTTEDVASWLNMAPKIGSLIQKIRSVTRGELSTSLIELLLLPKVRFVPSDPGKRRVPQATDLGYGSCVWPAAATTASAPASVVKQIPLPGSLS